MTAAGDASDAQRSLLTHLGGQVGQYAPGGELHDVFVQRVSEASKHDASEMIEQLLFSGAKDRRQELKPASVKQVAFCSRLLAERVWDEQTFGRPAPSEADLKAASMADVSVWITALKDAPWDDPEPPLPRTLRNAPVPSGVALLESQDW